MRALATPEWDRNAEAVERLLDPDPQRSGAEVRRALQRVSVLHPTIGARENAAIEFFTK